MREVWIAASRLLRRQRSFTATASLSLAIAMTATLAMFAVVNQLILRPPQGIRHPQDLFLAQPDPAAQSSQGRQSSSLSLPDIQFLRQHAPTSLRLFGVATREAAVDAGQGETTVRLQLVTSDYFDILGARPRWGQPFTSAASSDLDAAPDLVVTSEFAAASFGSAPAAVGRTVRVNGVGYRVVGVADAGFEGVDQANPVGWVSVGRLTDFGYDREYLRQRRSMWLSLYGRHERTTSLAVAALELNRVRASDAVGVADAADLGLSRPPILLIPLAERGASGAISPAKISRWLFAFSLILVFLSSLNVSLLFVARGYQRRRELVTRVALGAPTARLVRELTIEGFLIALFATVGSGALLMLARPGIEFALGARLTLLDWRTLCFAGAICLTITLTSIGLPVALTLGRLREQPNIVALMHATAYRPLPVRIAVVVQVALAFVLSATGLAFVSSVRDAIQVDLGIAKDHLAIIRLPSRDEMRVQAFLAAAQQQLAKNPQVQGSAQSVVAPLYGTLTQNILAPNAELRENAAAISIDANAVDSAYFATTGMRLLAGRNFTRADAAGAAQVVIVNETMARLYWPGADPVGKCLRGPENPAVRCALRIIGVISDAKGREITDEARPALFSPLAQSAVASGMLLVRTKAPAVDAVPGLRASLSVLDAPATVEIQTITGLLAEQTIRWRQAAIILSAFGVVALTFAAFGIYTSVTLAVTSERRASAIRLALGSTGVALTGKVLRDRAVELAIATGIGALCVGPTMRALAEIVSIPRIGLALEVALSAIGVVTVGTLSTLIATRPLRTLDPSSVLREA